jgi:hypothetical protein
MKRYLSGIVVVIALLLLTRQEAKAESVSLSEYRGQLHALIAKLDSLQDHPEGAGDLLASTPDRVTVNTNGGDVTVSYRDLKNDLAGFTKKDGKSQASLLRQLRKYCQDLEEGVQDRDQTEDLKGARADLTTILAQREFQNVHGPNAKDILLSKVGNWISRVLGRLFRAGAGRFDWFRIVSYPVIAAALILLIVWIARRLKRTEERRPREIIPFAPSARGWRSWLAEARDLAEQQEWRSAIHVAYWSGISFLEENGAWKPDRARTPREYLRIMGARKPQYPVLAALTKKFEVVWYGHENAREADYRETLGQLERLGCR